MPSPSLLLQDPFFYAFIVVAILLGWTWGRVRHLVGPLYETIVRLELERDSQARTIQGQRQTISQLEKRLERKPGDILVTPQEGNEQ